MELNVYYKKDIEKLLGEGYKRKDGKIVFKEVYTKLKGVRWIEFCYVFIEKGEKLVESSRYIGEMSKKIGAKKNFEVQKEQIRHFEKMFDSKKLPVYENGIINLGKGSYGEEIAVVTEEMGIEEGTLEKIITYEGELKRNNGEKFDKIFPKDKIEFFYSDKKKEILIRTQNMNEIYQKIRQGEELDIRKELPYFERDHIKEEEMKTYTTKENFYIAFEYDFEKEKGFSLFNWINGLEVSVSNRDFKTKKYYDTLGGVNDFLGRLTVEDEKRVNKIKEMVEKQQIEVTFENVTIHSEKIYKRNEEKINKGDIVRFTDEYSKEQIGQIVNNYDNREKIVVYSFVEDIRKINRVSKKNILMKYEKNENSEKIGFIKNFDGKVTAAKLVAEDEEYFIFETMLGKEYFEQTGESRTRYQGEEMHNNIVPCYMSQNEVERALEEANEITYHLKVRKEEEKENIIYWINEGDKEVFERYTRIDKEWKEWSDFIEVTKSEKYLEGMKETIIPLFKMASENNGYEKTIKEIIQIMNGNETYQTVEKLVEKFFIQIKKTRLLKK